MEDWGLYKTRILNMINHFCHLPLHIIVTCRAKWSEDKQGRSVLRTPNLSGKSAYECAAYFDEVLHMEANEGEDGKPGRVWRTFNDGRVIAKDASGILDPLEETNWTKLFTKILKKDAKKK